MEPRPNLSIRALKCSPQSQSPGLDTDQRPCLLSRPGNGGGMDGMDGVSQWTARLGKCLMIKEG